MVCQGQIGELIVVKLMVCCQILEEVVGIFGLYFCCYEVEIWFRVVEQNFEWLEDVLVQIDGQLDSFKCQFCQVFRYWNLLFEICVVEVFILYICWIEFWDVFGCVEEQFFEVQKQVNEVIVFQVESVWVQVIVVYKLLEFCDDVVKVGVVLQWLVIVCNELDVEECWVKECLQDLECCLV